MKMKFAVLGLGNIGKYCVEAIEAMPDAECIGVVRRKESLGKNPLDLRGNQDFASIDDLIAANGKPDVVLIASPSRNCPADAAMLLAKGICTVDSFDIHEQISQVVEDLGVKAKDSGAVCVTAAGWDPGSDSVLRALFEAMVPAGTTFTNFGRGRSMGHSVVARSKEGVLDATSITIPIGGGRHSRLVYVVLADGHSLDKYKADLLADDYFAHDPLDVRQVTAEEMKYVADASHGVLMERTGASGLTDNQILKFDMRINNPALTAQIMASCGRACVRLRDIKHYGAFTMIDLAPVWLLPGDRMYNIGRLV